MDLCHTLRVGVRLCLPASKPGFAGGGFPGALFSSGSADSAICLAPRPSRSWLARARALRIVRALAGWRDEVLVGCQWRAAACVPQKSLHLSRSALGGAHVVAAHMPLRALARIGCAEV